MFFIKSTFAAIAYVFLFIFSKKFREEESLSPFDPDPKEDILF